MASKNNGGGSSNNLNPSNPATGAGESSPGAAMLCENLDSTPKYVDPDQKEQMMENPGDDNDHLEAEEDDTFNNCSDEPPPPGTVQVDTPKIYFKKSWQNHIKPQLRDILLIVSDALGKRLDINSGWRCKAYNRKIGGASNSQHLYGNAVDVSTVNMSRDEKILMLDTALANGIGGIQIYSSFIHMDVGSRRAWRTTPSWARATYAQYSYPV